MKKYYLIITIVVIGFLAVGTTASSVSAQTEGSEKDQQEFRNLLKVVDGLIRSTHLNNGVSENRVLRLENRYKQFFSEEMNDEIFRFNENEDNKIGELNEGDLTRLENYYPEDNYSFSENAKIVTVVENERWVLKDPDDGYNHVLVEDNGEIIVYDREIYPSYMGISDEKIVKDCKELRKDIKDKASEEMGVDLSFIYEYSVLVILGVSITLSIIVSLVSRIVVDWEKVNRVQDKQSELQDKLKEARKENDSKKAHKIQKKQQEFMQQHMGTMFSPMKTMIIILIPFIIVFQILSSTYGGWAVAWLPFRLPWPDIGFLMFDRFFKGPVASLGFFGWYMLSYFGFSQVMRKILVPNR